MKPMYPSFTYSYKEDNVDGHNTIYVRYGEVIYADGGKSYRKKEAFRVPDSLTYGELSRLLKTVRDKYDYSGNGLGIEEVIEFCLL